MIPHSYLCRALRSLRHGTPQAKHRVAVRTLRHVKAILTRIDHDRAFLGDPDSPDGATGALHRQLIAVWFECERCLEFGRVPIGGKRSMSDPDCAISVPGQKCGIASPCPTPSSGGGHCDLTPGKRKKKAEQRMLFDSMASRLEASRPETIRHPEPLSREATPWASLLAA